MSNINTIFSDRIKREQEKRATYNKYIFNSHLVMFLLITFGAIIFNYSRWLENTDILSMKLVLFSIFLIMSYILATLNVKTFIKEADSVFLLPLESKYKEIIPRLYIFAIIVRLFLAIFFIFVSYPILQKLEIIRFDNLVFLSFIISLIISIIIFTIHTYNLAVYSKVVFNYLILVFLSYLFTVLLFIFNIFNFIFLLVIVYYLIEKKKIVHNINWYSSAEYDIKRISKYLKLVNMFVDIPINIIKVSRRKYFDLLIPRVNSKNFKSENTYNYYFIRAFLRQENTIFLVFRLFLVSLIFIYSFKNIYVSSVVIIVFNYLVVIQLLPIYKRLSSVMWFSLMPVSNFVKVSSFKKLIRNILLLFTFILVILSNLLKSWLLLLLTVLFSYFIILYFLRKVK